MTTKLTDKKTEERFYSVNRVLLAEDSGDVSDVEVLRAGIIRDRGLKISEQMLNDFINNFENGSYGTDLMVNLDHRGGEAAGWIKKLFLDPMDKSRLMATIEWTKLGVEKIKDKLYKFVSAEFSTKYPHHKTGKLVDNVFSGLALTNTPALKGQSPIALSEDIEITNNGTMKWIEDLKARSFVSKDMKEVARSMFNALSEEVQAENKEGMEAVEAKPEVDPVVAEAEAKAAEEKAAAEKAEAEKKAAEEAAKAAEGKTAEQLSVKLMEITTQLSAAQAEKAELKERLDKRDLSEKFEKKVMLSHERTTGMTKDSMNEFVSFMSALSEEQREKAMALFAKVKTVSLEEIGSADAEEVKTEEGKVDAAADLAEAQKMSEKNGKNPAENLMEIYSKRNAK